MLVRPSHFAIGTRTVSDVILTFGGSSEALVRMRDLASALGVELTDYVVDGRVRGLMLTVVGEDSQVKSETIMALWSKATEGVEDRH